MIYGSTDNETGEIVMRGLYIGNNVRCYDMAVDVQDKVGHR